MLNNTAARCQHGCFRSAARVHSCLCQAQTFPIVAPATPTDRAVEFARAHPGEAYFPWHPLATLVAEGRLDHLEYGLLDLSFAGRKPDRDLLLAGLPDRLEYVVYPEPPFSNYVFNLLGGNLVPSSTESLPGFTVYSLTDTIRASSPRSTQACLTP